ncbi:MAG: sigma-70 family RNA polymerase sigma factor [Planctomycetes bacterium]|jgi:RNA polymerase sigma-70 factor (ECF subfamily)|nr:sigma-70 family RNA polymerase sigma factor [Planctomycetota bacterium]
MAGSERTDVTIEDLLAFRGRVRRLAVGLLGDESRADDVVQETWLTALGNPPARRTGLGGWFARVVRSRAFDLLRSESRRTAREHRAARPEAIASGPDTAAEAETCRRLAEAVCALPPTAREVVVLHYYRGLTCRETAGRLGIPVETVRTRLRRALERLRAALGGGDHGRLRLLLLPLVPTPASAAPLTGIAGGGLLMALKLKVATGIVFFALLAAGLWHLSTPPGGPDGAPPLEADRGFPARPQETAPKAAPRSSVKEVVLPEPSHGAIPKGSPEVVPAERPPPEGAAPRGTVLGRVRLDGSGPAAGVAVALTWVGRPEEKGEVEQRHQRIETESDGTFRLEEIPAGTCHLRVMLPGYGTETVSVTMGETAGPPPVEIVLRMAGALLVRVRDRNGAPAPRMFLDVRGPEPQLFTSASTGPDGSVRLGDLAPGTWTVGVRGVAGHPANSGGPPRPGDRSVEVVSGETAELTIDFALARVMGTALLSDGSPVVSGFVYLRSSRPDFQSLSARTDESGRFTLDTTAEGEFDVSVNVVTPARFLSPAGRVTIAAGEVTELNVRISATSVTGRLRRADTGEPVAKATVSATPVRVDADGPPAGAAAGAAGGVAWPAEDGTFTLCGLAPGAYELRATPHDRRLGTRTLTVAIPESGRVEGVDIAFDVKPVGVLRLRVLDETGAGVERLQVSVRRGTTGSTFPATHLGGGVHEIVLDPGEQVVELQVSGYHIENIKVEIAEAEVLDREIRLTPFRR